MDDVLHVDQAPQSQVAGDADRVIDDVVELGLFEAGCWIHRIRVTRVHARPLDVLHDTRDHFRVAVGDSFDLEFVPIVVFYIMYSKVLHSINCYCHEMQPFSTWTPANVYT